MKTGEYFELEFDDKVDCEGGIKVSYLGTDEFPYDYVDRETAIKICDHMIDVFKIKQDELG